ncbi:MAG: HlyD family efflux transporter periplasmic adaptor subunit [Clostridiaceae bacterium]
MTIEDKIELKPAGKKLLKKITYLFIAIMLLLTFFSSTINNLGLIRVVAADVRAGRLEYSISGLTVATPAEIKEIFPECALNVESLEVKDGDSVVKGQILAVFDVKDLEKALKVKERELESARAKIRAETLNYDFTIKNAEKKAASSKNELAVSLELYVAGVESSANIEKLRNESETDERELDKLMAEKAAAMSEMQRGADELEQDIASLKSDIVGFRVLLSPADGYIWEMNAKRGAMADTSGPIFKIACNGGRFNAVFTVDKPEAKNLRAGDKMKITVPSMDDKKIDAQISSIKPAGTSSGTELEISASFEGAGLKGGEMIEIEITRESEFSDTIIPNSAVRKDVNGRDFVYVVKERESSLGKEYYLQKAFIYIKASDMKETAVASGLFPFECVVAESDRPVTAGDRVKLRRE